jgi:hypothetical protein
MLLPLTSPARFEKFIPAFGVIENVPDACCALAVNVATIIAAIIIIFFISFYI